METGRVLQSVTETMTDGMGGIKPLKAMNRDYLLAPLLSSETRNLEFLQYRLFIVSAIPQILRGPIIVSIMALGLYIVVNQALLPVVSVIPLALLFQRSAQQFGATQTAYQSIKKMEPFLVGLETNISKADSMREDWQGKCEPNFVKEIKFNNVVFAYDNKVILNKSSLSIKKNEFIALVGPSGTGKTTLLDILIGLHIPASGELLIDGINLLDIDIKKWRSSIGYVPQDLFLFHDTIANNISLGDPAINNSMIEDALKSAGAWEFVSELPDSLQTSIGERGLKLSGGQRQRISIARALVSEPQLLILDEATTALDPKTEKNILSTLSKLSEKGITIVAVSHQSVVLDVAEKAYRLNNGEIKRVNRNT
jgi:ATP-binding cassette subfamily C protein